MFKLATGLGTTKMVLVVRTDLKMGRGKIASQCAHAAIMLYEAAVSASGVPLKSWMYSGQPKVVLRGDSEEMLLGIFEGAKECGLNVCMVRDAGRTEVDVGTLTVVGVGPNKVDEIDKLTRHLKLLS